MADLILYNGKITTLDPQNPDATAIWLKNGLVEKVGSDEDILKSAGKETQQIDLKKRRVIPGLNDSHLHLIRGGAQLQHGIALGRSPFPGSSHADA